MLSAGEVYGVDTFAGSLLILVGLAIYSPVLSMASLTGGAIGTVTALYYTALPRWGLLGFCLILKSKPRWADTLFLCD